MIPATEDREEPKPARRPLTADEALSERLDQGREFYTRFRRERLGVDGETGADD